jgi:predicted transcriptional regulator
MAERLEMAEILSACYGIYQRIARKLDVSPSMVSRVVSGARKSAEIEAALREELKKLKKQLDSYLD